MSVASFRDLVVWQKAMTFVTDVYRATADFPKCEMYGLTSQLRRAAVSVPSNIAEGHGRTGTREYLHHLSIAHGSLCEVETQLMIACQLAYIPLESSEQLLSLASEIGRMLNALITSLERKLHCP